MPQSAPLSAHTFGNEDALPRVPLPSLDDTCARFLEWCAPLLTPGELAETEAAVAQFARPDGPARILHVALVDYDSSDGVHSWLDVFWPYRYLGRRDRIALNANFFFLFDDSGPVDVRPDDPQHAQVHRAAGLIAGALEYKQLIDDERLAPATQRGRPLTMEQNRYLFSTTRIPGTDLDSVRTPYSEPWPGPSTERHVVVFHRGSMLRMDVLDADGRAYSPADLEAGLRAVLAASAHPAGPDTSVGHLTTKARAEWATSRQALLDVAPANADALDTIERALFCVCLEDWTPGDPLEASDALLHGNSANRWFDKAVSLIVFADGTAGFNGEHCCLDGTTDISMIDYILESAGGRHTDLDDAQAPSIPAVLPIEFVLDDELRADVRSAADAFDAYAADTATTTVSIEDVGSEAIKSLGMSPDAFAQLCYQLAHRRAKGLIGSTYESIAMRRYRNGRTEAMRVVTPEIVRFAEAMDDPGFDAAARVTLARAAADAHVARAKQCQAGGAPEQHLWELQLIARRRGAELGVTEPLALYESPGWLIMRDDYLSTSAVPSVNVQYWGFGSTSERCIGVAYALLPDTFHLYLSTLRSVGEQMLRFAEELPVAARELRRLLATGSPEQSHRR